VWVAPTEALAFTLPANDEVSIAALVQLRVNFVAVNNAVLI